MTTWLHDQRFYAVRDVLVAQGARSVLDLGCGVGDFLIPLTGQAQITRVTGVEQAPQLLDQLRRRLADLPDARRVKATLREASLLSVGAELGPFDAVVMIEVIEHLDPAHLSVLERVLFQAIDARAVILTTPNADFNPLIGVPPHRFRHPDHRFEWGRERFRLWAGGVALRHARTVTFQDVGGLHPTLGGASQIAVFTWKQALAGTSDQTPL